MDLVHVLSVEKTLELVKYLAAELSLSNFLWIVSYAHDTLISPCKRILLHKSLIY